MSGTWDSKPSKATPAWATLAGGPRAPSSQNTAAAPASLVSTTAHHFPSSAAPLSNPWSAAAVDPLSSGSGKSTNTLVSSSRELAATEPARGAVANSTNNPFSSSAQQPAQSPGKWWQRTSGTKEGSAADAHPSAEEKAASHPLVPVPSPANKNNGGRTAAGTKTKNTAGRRYRFALRSLQFFFSCASLAFIATSGPFSGLSSPRYERRAVLYFLYATSGISALWSLLCLINIGCQRIFDSRKFVRWVLVFCDMILAAFWVILCCLFTPDTTCNSKDDGGWCGFFYASLGFGFAATVASVGCFAWSLLGSCCQRRK